MLAAEAQLLGDELDSHAPFGQLADQATQVVEVAGQAVHRVDDDNVTSADEREHHPQLGSGGALARKVSVNNVSTSTPSSCLSGLCPRELTRM
jgi:hypothetical protein